jgi:DNA-binding beta-propeller fold protein YncE
MRVRRLWFAVLGLTGACGPPAIDFSSDDARWPARAVPAWSRTARLAVTENNDDTVAFVSLDVPQPTLHARVPVGDIPVEVEGPHDLTASPDGAYLYVVISDFAPGSGTGPHGAHGSGTVPGSLLKLDARDNHVLAEAVLDPDAGEILLSDDGAVAWVTHYDVLRLQRQIAAGLPEEAGFSKLAVVDTASMARPPLYPVCPAAHDLELSGDGRTLYVTCQMTDQIALFDVDTHAVRRFDLGPTPATPLRPQCAPFGVLLAPTDGRLWISCNQSGELRVFDPQRGAVEPARTLPLDGIPMFGAFLSDGRTLLHATQGNDQLVIIDTLAGKIAAAVPLPPAACLNARNVEVSDDDRIAWVVCEGDHTARRGSVVAIDVPARAVLGYVEVGLFPDAVTLAPPAP